MSRPTLLCYCQHSVGLGHLMRSYALCGALTERFRVVLLCGGALPTGIGPPPGVQVLALPPLGVGPDGSFVSHDPRYSVEQAWAVRSERILAAFRAVRPVVVLVELFPFGRAKFARELVPLLEAARAAGALTACSLRDILVASRADQQAYDDRAAGATLANAHLDAVLVHSDPGFARVEETFAPRRPLRVPVHYTGFVVRDGAPPGPPRGEHVLVSAGGGLVGEPQLERALVQPRRRQRHHALTNGSASHRQRVDRVRLAARARPVAHTGHQLRRHADHPLAAGDQKPLQPPGHMPAVLDRPHPLAAHTTRPAQQHVEPVRIRGPWRHRPPRSPPRPPRRSSIACADHTRARSCPRPLSNRQGNRRRTRLNRGGCHAPIRSRRRSSDGDERHNRLKVRPTGRHPNHESARRRRGQ